MNPCRPHPESQLATMVLALLLAVGVVNVVEGQVPSENAWTFVLVHGAWHGGWAWEPVVARLRQQGQTVFAPTLTGLGDKHETPLSEIDLSTHIDDIVSVMERNDLSDVVLVGHSYAGIVVAGVLGRQTGRVSKAVFLDAVIPEDGDTFFQTVGVGIAGTILVRFLVLFDRWMPPPAADDWGERWGITGAHREFIEARIQDHPPLTLVEPVNWTPSGQSGIEYFYIGCEQNTNNDFAAFGEAARADPRWTYVGLDSHHDAMLLAPDELTAVLLEIAQQ